MILTPAAEELLAADRAFAARSREVGPAEAFRQFVSADATLLTGNPLNVVGRDAIHRYMQSLPAGTTLTWEPKAADVAASGELGWTWGHYRYAWSDPESVEGESRGTYLNVWQRNKQAEWKVLLDLGSPGG